LDLGLLKSNAVPAMSDWLAGALVVLMAVGVILMVFLLGWAVVEVLTALDEKGLKFFFEAIWYGSK